MQPSIDTLLVCHGVQLLFSSSVFEKDETGFALTDTSTGNTLLHEAVATG